MINLAISQVLKRLGNKGYEAYLVGGAVRSFLLGLPVNDYDVTTSADPSAIRLIFADYPTYDLGRKLGTVGVKIDGLKIEITPFRKEGNYADHRHPEEIEYTDVLSDDLKRRDFTINALCMDKDGKIIDLYNGTDDLKNRIIRAIGNPDTRFNEDALRILRALRFKAKLDFTIEENTRKSLFSNKELLKHISMERKKDELMQILSYENAFSILREYKDIFDTFIEINRIDRKINNFNNPLYSLAYLYSLNDFDLSKLKLSNQEIQLIKTLAILNSIDPEDDYAFISSLANIHALDCLNYLNCLYENDFRLKYESLKEYIITLNDLDIDGKTIISFSYEGKMIGTVKEKLLDLIHHKNLTNNKDSLIKYLEENRL